VMVIWLGSGLIWELMGKLESGIIWAWLGGVSSASMRMIPGRFMIWVVGLDLRVS
jgi:hypothetical protein